MRKQARTRSLDPCELGKGPSWGKGNQKREASISQSQTSKALQCCQTWFCDLHQRNILIMQFIRNICPYLLYENVEIFSFSAWMSSRMDIGLVLTLDSDWNSHWQLLGLSHPWSWTGTSIGFPASPAFSLQLGLPSLHSHVSQFLSL